MADRQRLLELALRGLEADRARLDAEISDLRREISGAPRAAEARTTGTAGAPRKRIMSAEARRKISEAMKRRHAERRRAAGKK